MNFHPALGDAMKQALDAVDNWIGQSFTWKRFDGTTGGDAVRGMLATPNFTSIAAIADEPACTFRADGQPALQLQVQRDVLGAKRWSRRVEWSYYPTGEINTITVVDLNASDKEIARRVIKHYTDGRQPEVMG